MSSAESASTDPFYNVSKLPTIPLKGPFTLADKYGNIVSPISQTGGKKITKHKKYSTRRRKTHRMRKTRRKRKL